MRPTAYSESWKMSNIYDLAGNVAEYTMEALAVPNTNNLIYKSVRGGCYYTYNTGCSPAWRDSAAGNAMLPTWLTPIATSSLIGCRAVLILV